MDLVVRAVFLYLFILLVLRIAGKRTLAEVTTFDFILLLLIAETTDNSIIGEDNALTSTALVIITFVVIEIVLTFVKERSKTLDKWLEGTPIVIVENGKLIKKRAEQEKIDESDVLAEARKLQGLERMDQIKYAVLEKNGGISIIPKTR